MQLRGPGSGTVSLECIHRPLFANVLKLQFHCVNFSQGSRLVFPIGYSIMSCKPCVSPHSGGVRKLALSKTTPTCSIPALRRTTMHLSPQV